MKKLNTLSGVVLPLATLGAVLSNADAAILYDTEECLKLSDNTTVDPNPVPGYLLVGNTFGDGFSQAFIKFDVSSLVGVNSAIFEVNDATFNNSADTWQVMRVSSPWNFPAGADPEPNYNSSTASTSDVVGTFVASGNDSSVYQFDVTDIVNDWIQNPSTNFGLSIRYNIDPVDDPQGQINFVRSGTSLGPRLDVSVPEPTISGIMILSGLMLLPRRRKPTS